MTAEIDSDMKEANASLEIPGVSSFDGSDEGDLFLDREEQVVIEKNDRSLSELHRWFQTKRLVIDPEWQRGYVWDKPRASKLIESFLFDLPIPVIYLAKTDEGKYEVIDGVQRLTSVFKFFDKDFKLSGLQMMKELNNLDYDNLDEKLRNKLQDVTLRTFELSPKTSKNLLFIIFERLNTGGVPLSEMEIRNCVYRGKLNDLIRDLAHNNDFVQAINQKNIDRRMADRSLVLRFLAFYERTYLKATGGLKDFFNDFLEHYRFAGDDKITEYSVQFRKSMKASLTVFGKSAFRLRRIDDNGNGDWAPRINASIFQILATSFTNYDLHQLTLNADAIREDYIDLVSSDQNWIDAVTKSTGDADKIRYSFQTWYDRLNKTMEFAKSLDKKRIFSSALKQQLFDANKACIICGNQIMSPYDAAVDHIDQYWRGGKTIPTNARLVHRLCNTKRPKLE